MGKQTPLYGSHVQAQAKIVDFAGWDMPLHYGSQLQEHHHVRQTAGVFDVSHMTIVDLNGAGVTAFLRHLLANDIAKLTPGKALYTCMLDEKGGVIDDLIVYKVTDEFYRLVVNSGTRDKDLAWLNKQAKNADLKLLERTDYAMLALQGPKVRDTIPALFSPASTATILSLKPFHFAVVENYFIARTGYTGEEGFEIILPATDAAAFWEKF